MSSAILYRAIYGAMAVLTSFGVPPLAAWFVYQHTSNLAVATAVAVVLIYQSMALSLAALSLWEYIPDSLPLGPSFMAGHGLLTFGMTLLPLAVLPGLVWLYVLPFDEQGYFDSSATFGLEPERFDVPHHDGRGEVNDA